MKLRKSAFCQKCSKRVSRRGFIQNIVFRNFVTPILVLNACRSRFHAEDASRKAHGHARFDARFDALQVVQLLKNALNFNNCDVPAPARRIPGNRAVLKLSLSCRAELVRFRSFYAETTSFKSTSVMQQACIQVAFDRFELPVSRGIHRNHARSVSCVRAFTALERGAA